MPRIPSRWRALALLLPAVLLLHGLMLGLLPVGVGSDFSAGVQRVVQVRQIVMPPPAAPAPPVRRPPPPAPAAAAPLAPPVTVEVAAAAPPPAAPEAPPVAVAAATPAAEPASAAEPAPPPAEGGGTPPPVYATRLPPSLLLRYDLKRGAASGSGEMTWRVADGRYSLAMTGTVFGIALLQWESTGLIDAAGIAPERFTDRRVRRAVQAANFQRAAGRITFSGPQTEYPLVAGAQDRLSWMLQLPAIVAADPAAFGPGARIAVFVAGARGDADVWTFEVLAAEPLDVPAGRLDATLHLRRLPRKPYDTQVDVWLDPAHHHLPARARLAVAETGEGTEFVLTGSEPLK